MGIKLNVDLDGLTWGELIGFVDAARATGLGGDHAVEYDIDPMDTENRILGLQVEVSDLGERTVTFDHATRLQYAEALSRVLETDGDGRAVLGELQDLRNGLLR